MEEIIKEFFDKFLSIEGCKESFYQTYDEEISTFGVSKEKYQEQLSTDFASDLTTFEMWVQILGWASSDEGFVYWQDIDEKWRHACKNNNNLILLKDFIDTMGETAIKWIIERIEKIGDTKEEYFLKTPPIHWFDELFKRGEFNSLSHKNEKWKKHLQGKFGTDIFKFDYSLDITWK